MEQVLTDAQFYLRLLEEIVKNADLDVEAYNDIDDLNEYMVHTLGVKPYEEDSGESVIAASETIRNTLFGLVQALGEKVGVQTKLH